MERILHNGFAAAISTEGVRFFYAGPAVEGIAATAIPYFQWDNRGPGAMRAWIPDR